MRFLLMTLSCLVGGAARTHGWSKPAFTSKAPKVSGQSVGSHHHDDDDDYSTFLFGGLTGAAGSPCTDETWELQAAAAEKELQEWTLIETKTKPRVRMYAASAVLDDKLFMFGGWDPGAPGSGGEFLDDVWQFDFATKEWSLLENVKLPFPVSRHTACTIHGGDGASPMIIVHTYKGILVFQDGKLSEQPTTGEAPDGFSMCAAAPLNDSQLLLFGGSTRTQQMSQDAYVLDTASWTWTKLEKAHDSDECPPILASACAAQAANNQVLILGGASIGATGYEGGMGLIPQNDTWLLKVADGKAYWSKVSSSTDEEKPDGRVAASLSPIGPSSFLLQGGYDPLTKTTFDEPWVLNL